MIAETVRVSPAIARPFSAPTRVLITLVHRGSVMPLTPRTERALEACYDAILAPSRWSTALQLLAESLGGVSCTFYEHDRDSPASLPISTEHEALTICGHATRPTLQTRMSGRTLNDVTYSYGRVTARLSNTNSRRRKNAGRCLTSKKRRGQRSVNGLR